MTNTDWFGRSSSGAFAHARQASRGFTLIELLATMVVLVILTTIAAPHLSSTVSNNRAYAAQAELLASLALARSEAVTRGVPVAVGAAMPTSGNEFGGGWTVWVDQNGHGALDVGEVVLRTHESLPSNAVKIGGPTTPVSYGSMGFLRTAGTVNMSVCPVGYSHKGFAITIQPNGLSDVDSAAACP